MTTLIRAPRAPRSDNRLSQIVDEAARLFGERGYRATSIRDVAAAVEMLPGSLYYHFESKEDLLVAIYEKAIKQISDAVIELASSQTDPWKRLEMACIAHLEALLRDKDYSQVIVRVLPNDVPKARVRLIGLRDEYEELFTDFIGALRLPPGVDRRYLRLMLLGALNSAMGWYQEGKDTPRTIARRFLRLLKESLQIQEEEHAHERQ